MHGAYILAFLAKTAACFNSVFYHFTTSELYYTDLSEKGK
jgi:hypothetical protein